MDYVNNNLSCTREKASISASLKKTVVASVTVEAVICVPLFLYASVCLIWMLELRALQFTVRCALQQAAREMVVELSEVPILIPERLEAKVQNIIGEDKLRSSFVVDGIHCEKSYVWGNTGIMELSARYKVKLPFPHFFIQPLEYTEKMRMKAWNGYQKDGSFDFSTNEIVYVTETGVVYHKDFYCNYLDLSIRAVNQEIIDDLRNQGGGKYYPCGLCGESTSGKVYITDYGNRYHAEKACSGVRRTVYAVPIEEVKGKGACAKCGN